MLTIAAGVALGIVIVCLLPYIVLGAFALIFPARKPEPPPAPPARTGPGPLYR